MTEINKQQIRERLGNLDQIRDLLFGEKIEYYERQFQSCQNRIDKLDSQLQQFERETHDRLSWLQNSISTEIRSGLDSLEQKIKYLDLSAREKNTKIKQEIDSLEGKTAENFEEIHHSFTGKNNLIKDELERVKQEVETNFQTLKQRTILEIKKEFLELKNDKFSRIDLAEVLFEICLKLRGDELLARGKTIEKDHHIPKLSAENHNSYQQLNDSSHSNLTPD